MNRFLWTLISFFQVTAITHAQPPKPKVPSKANKTRILVDQIEEHLHTAEETTLEVFFARYLFSDSL